MKRRQIRLWALAGTLILASSLHTNAQDKSVKELYIPYGEGENIYGLLSEPCSQSPKQGVAIISHGFNGSHQFGKDYFKTLNDLGYFVYTFDFPCGSVRSLTDNNTMNMSIVDEVKAVKTIVRYFQQQKNIDKKHIVLIGESQGGLVSALAAAELGKAISQMVLIYPAFCISENWDHTYPRVEDIPDTTSLWGVNMGKRFFLEIRDMDVFGTISKYSGPVLIVHGSNDPIVGLDFSERAEKVYRDVQLKIIQGAGHGFKPAERAISNQYVDTFLKKAGK